MQKHRHEWTNRILVAGGQTQPGTLPDYTVSVWWNCHCGASRVQQHFFLPPAVESEQLEAEGAVDCTCKRHDATFGCLLA